MAIIFPRNFQNSFDDQFWNTSRGKNLSRGIAFSRVRASQRRAIQAFEVSPVTQELEGGKNAPNISKTINYKGPIIGNATPNLFTFFGFTEGSNPVNSLRKLLNSPVKLNQATIRNSVHSYDLSVWLSDEKIEEATKVNPNVGNFSWALAIEEGNGVGINNYLTIENKGRSKGGLQLIRVSFPTDFQSYPYISEIAKDFNERLRS